MEQILCQNNYISQMTSGVSPIAPKPYDGITGIKSELNANDYWVASHLGERPNRINPKLLISGDYNIFNEGWNGWGTYMASGTYKSKTFKLPIYIGSVWRKEGFSGRITTDHIVNLNNGKHDNSIFRRSWKKYGSDNFVWWMLELCEPDRKTCLAVEQKYFDLFRPFSDENGGFNINHLAIGGGKKHTEATKKLISEKNKGNKFFLGKKHSEETKRKMSEAKRGKPLTEKQIAGYKNRVLPKCNNLSAEMRLKAAEVNSREYSFISPDGEIFIGKNIAKFVSNKNLDSSAMRDVMSGKRPHHKGWKVYGETVLEKNS